MAVTTRRHRLLAVSGIVIVAGGLMIRWLVHTGVGHFEVRTTSAPLVADWLLARVRDTPAPSSCTTTTT